MTFFRVNVKIQSIIFKRKAVNMRKKQIAVTVTGGIMLLCSLLLFVGIITFFAPCGPKEDGSYMACHWFGQAVMGTSAVLSVLSVLHLIFPQDIKLGLGMAMTACSALTVALANGLMGTCMMESMTCNAVTKPAVTVIGGLLIIVSVIDIVLLALNRNKGDSQ